MIWLSAPPISSMISASSAGNPPVGGAACRLAKGTGRLPELTSLVASTTRVLIEAMALVKVSPAVVLSAAVLSGPRDAAVESEACQKKLGWEEEGNVLMAPVYCWTSVKSVSIRAMAPGSSVGPRRLDKMFLDEGAPRAKGEREPARARMVMNDFIVEEWFLSMWERGFLEKSRNTLKDVLTLSEMSG